LNVIYLSISLKVSNTDIYFYKYTYGVDYKNNIDMINKLFVLEQMLLDGVDVPGIKKTYKLKDNLLNSSIRIYETLDCSNKKIQGKYTGEFMLKISGIWSTTTTCGLTYKFYKSPHPSDEK